MINARHRTRFDVTLDRALGRRGLRREEFCREGDAVARRLLEEYGALFVASAAVAVPPVCVFSSREEVLKFQEAATWRAETLDGITIELQPAAMDTLLAARDEARREGLNVTPRGGAEAARRGFDDTLRLWDSRFLPALDYWCAPERGRLSTEQVETLRSLAPMRQVAEVLELEKRGIFFSKDFSKTILQSVAAPGASQHLSMLAFDVAEFMNPAVRRVLARHGWFQTVESDLPHFTFLGRAEIELPAHGLRPAEAGGQVFWVPDLEGNDERGTMNDE